MDKYEYKLRTEQMLEFMDEGEFAKAAEIADTIDWRRVRNASMLASVADIYENNRNYNKSYEVLKVVYDRAEGSRKIVYRLGLLALHLGNVDEAIDYYDEFAQIAPKDPNRYILKYKILRARRAPIEQQIEALEEYKKAEYIEEWAYELAKLYQEAGMTAECLEECDDLILWFSEGEYVYKAMELKMQYKPLTPSQMEKYNNREAVAEEVVYEEFGPEEIEEIELEKPVELNEEDAETFSEAPSEEILEDIPEEEDLEEEEPEEELPVIKRSPVKTKDGIGTNMSLADAIQAIVNGNLQKEAEDEITYEEEEVLEIPEEIFAELEKSEELAEEELVEEETSEEESVVSEPAVEAAPEAAAEPEEDDGQIKGQMTLEELLGGWGAPEPEKPKAEEKPVSSLGVQQLMHEINLAELEADFYEDDAEEAEEEKEVEIPEEILEEETLEEIIEEVEDDFDDFEEEDLDDFDEEELEDDFEELDDFDEEELEEDELDEEEYEDDEYDEEEYEDDEYDEEEYEDDEYDEEEYEDDEYDEEEYEDDEYDEEEYEDDEYDEEEYEDDEYDEEEYEDDEYDEEEYEDDEYDEEEYEDDEYDEEDDFDDFDDFDEEELEEDEELLEEEPFEEELEEDDDDDLPDLLSSTQPLSRKETAKMIATGKTAPLPLDEISNALSMNDTGFIVHGRYDLETQSGIGTRAGLTEEQKKLFSYFVPVRGMSEQLVDVLEQDKNCTNRHGTSRTGNLVIIGRKGSGKTVLAVDVVKAIHKQRNIQQGKVAIVTGDALNQKRISDIVDKLYGGALIIEKAGKMNEKTVAKLNKAMEGDTGEMLVVLEEQRKPLDRLLTSNREFRRKFTSRLEVPIFINDELVTFGQTYARGNGYRIDEMGILALYSRIDALQREDHAVTVSEVKEVMDEAIARSQKASAKRLVKRVFGKGKDEADRIILSEKDFNI